MQTSLNTIKFPEIPFWRILGCILLLSVLSPSNLYAKSKIRTLKRQEVQSIEIVYDNSTL